MKIKLLIFLFICISCNNSNKTIERSNNDTLLQQDTIKDINKNQQIHSNQDSVIYEFTNDTILQQLKLIMYTDKEIIFNLSTENKLRKMVNSIEGRAFHTASDDETEADNNGYLYTVSEYLYEKKDCWLSIRIDADKKLKVIIYSADCISENKYCPFNSVGTLLKK